jgi:hypothetical protein
MDSTGAQNAEVVMLTVDQVAVQTGLSSANGAAADPVRRPAGGAAVPQGALGRGRRVAAVPGRARRASARGTEVGADSGGRMTTAAVSLVGRDACFVCLGLIAAGCPVQHADLAITTHRARATRGAGGGPRGTAGCPAACRGAHGATSSPG